MTDGTISSFRKQRGRILSRMIENFSKEHGRPVTVLDIGGRRDYWDNVGFSGIEKITLLNIDPADLGRTTKREDVFIDKIGGGRNISEIKDQQFDFYHSNSVIEHVGSWGDMKNMAKEARRVSKAGWIQTPAWEFPIEPHFRLPFMHWFATHCTCGAACYSEKLSRTRS